MEPIIDIQNLTYRYPEDPEDTLRGLNLKILPGSFVAVLGHNGSGKSTLAKHLNSILLPTGGKVLVNGMDTADEALLIQIRRTVGMVFQNPDNQIVANVVEDDVAFAPENLGVPPAEIRQRVDDALRAVGMYEYRLHAPHLLSGGQKQRVAIAGVIAMQPRCIVLDEPTAMLDPAGRREVLATVHQLCREQGITVVLITHHMDECIGADRVLVMSHGRIVLDGGPADVFAQVERLKAEGLSVPETTELLWELNQTGMHLPLSALSVEDCAQVIAMQPNVSQTETARSEPTIPRAPSSVPRAEAQRSEPVLTTEGLTHVYSQGTPFEKVAIDHIDMEIYAGQLVGLIGHTGSGKSTFIQHLDGLLRPSSGRVLYRGADIFGTKEATRDVRFQVGLVFQYPEYQLFEETVYKDIAFGPKNMKLSETEIDERVREAAGFVGVPEDLFERSPLELSGGQKRRVAIAGVIAMRPGVLILDEPTAGLDPAGRESILENIRQYHTVMGGTVILVTHSMEDIARMADRLIVFQESHVVMDGTPAEVFSRAAELQSMGLSVPGATAIAGRLRELGVPLPGSIYTIEQLRAAVLREKGGRGTC
jgi:energy-coupling factor transporter ATPase